MTREEAIKILRETHDNALFSVRTAIETLIPELKESEDERIRKAIQLILIATEDEQKDFYSTHGLTRKDCTDWLEKQKDLDKMIVVSPEVWDKAINDAYENGKKDGEKQKEQNPVEMDVYVVCKGTTICGQDYKCKKDYNEGNCWYIKDVIYHCGRDGYLNDQNGVSWSCTPEWFNEYIYTNSEWADEEKNYFVSGQFLRCKLSFEEFKEGEHYWLEYVGDDMYVGRSDNILNQKFHITPRQLFTLFSQELGKYEKQKEQKPVEIDEEINRWMGCEAFPEGTNITPLPQAMEIVERTAKHFFELGEKTVPSPGGYWEGFNHGVRECQVRIRDVNDTMKEQKPVESISQLTVQGKGVYKICPRCKERMVRDDSMVYTSMPPQYIYECPKCGERKCDTVMYDNPEMEERKPTEWSEEDIKKIRSEEYTKGYNDAAFGGKLKEWSVEDEDRIRQIERIAQQAGCTQKLQEEIHDWLKSLLERFNLQPKQEWSVKGRRGRIGTTPKHIRKKAESFLSKMEPPYDADDICSAYETGAMENFKPSWSEEDEK